MCISTDPRLGGLVLRGGVLRGGVVVVLQVGGAAGARGVEVVWRGDDAGGNGRMEVVDG